MFDDGGLELGCEEREEFFAEAGAEARGVLIGGVLAPGLFFGAEVGAEVGPTDVKQRADDGFGLGMDAAEAGEAGAAEDVGEDGFGLVVGGVGYGDAIDFFCGDEAGEKVVAGAAGGVFEIGFFAFGLGGDVEAFEMKVEMMLGGELGDEFFVGVGGAAAELVI
jgi:hypothetical protein